MKRFPFQLPIAFLEDQETHEVECREERRFESPLIGSHLWTHRSFPVKREDREDIQDKEKRRGEP